jgi:hypothetical protein
MCLSWVNSGLLHLLFPPQKFTRSRDISEENFTAKKKYGTERVLLKLIRLLRPGG